MKRNFFHSNCNYQPEFRNRFPPPFIPNFDNNNHAFRQSNSWRNRPIIQSNISAPRYNNQSHLNYGNNNALPHYNSNYSRPNNSRTDFRPRTQNTLRNYEGYKNCGNNGNKNNNNTFRKFQNEDFMLTRVTDPWLGLEPVSVAINSESLI